MHRINLRAFFLFCGLLCSHAQDKDYSEPVGSTQVVLAGGSPVAPNYWIVSPGYKGEAIYRGFVDHSNENNVSFHTTPDLANPFVQVGPFQAGVLASKVARAEAVLDANGSITSISIVSNGENYDGEPKVIIAAPVVENGELHAFENAYARANLNESNDRIDSIAITHPGRGYQTPPRITVDGGSHFIRLTDPDSIHYGLCFSISGNTDRTLTLENPSGADIESIFTPSSRVEVFRGWTIGSFLGYEHTPLHSDQNSTLADWIYLTKNSVDQNDSSFHSAYFHDGQSWKSVDNPALDASDHPIRPDESIILARRFADELTLNLQGSVLMDANYLDLPEKGKRRLGCNPYPTDVMLSDLIASSSMTTANELNSSLWMTDPNPDYADNLQIIKGSLWMTYWHDGSNLQITEHARISARRGSGFGGSMTPVDFSFSSGEISSLTNSTDGNLIITSNSHGLKDGFLVEISGVMGYRTDENDQRIDGDGNLIVDGPGFVIESSVNGKWEILKTTAHTFELSNANLDCEFINDGKASWATGFAGSGYDSNVSLSIIGGNGQGAKATGIVEDGKIVSISMKSGGIAYVKRPEVMVHPGGWKSIVSGNVPSSTLRIPAGSGFLIIRKHPTGIASRLALEPFVER